VNLIAWSGTDVREPGGSFPALTSGVDADGASLASSRGLLSLVRIHLAQSRRQGSGFPGLGDGSVDYARESGFARKDSTRNEGTTWRRQSARPVTTSGSSHSN
jgi:hypothetical protein